MAKGGYQLVESNGSVVLGAGSTVGGKGVSFGESVEVTIQAPLTAANGLAEMPILVAPFDLTVTKVSVTSSAALTANDTNYATFRVKQRTSAGLDMAEGEVVVVGDGNTVQFGVAPVIALANTPDIPASLALSTFKHTDVNAESIGTGNGILNSFGANPLAHVDLFPGSAVVSSKKYTPVVAETVGSGNGANKTFTPTLANTPVVPGSVTITDPGVVATSATSSSGSIDFSTLQTNHTYAFSINSDGLGNVNFINGTPVGGYIDYAIGATVADTMQNFVDAINAHSFPVAQPVSASFTAGGGNFFNLTIFKDNPGTAGNVGSTDYGAISGGTNAISGQTITDDSNNNLIGDIDVTGNNTINYGTGACDFKWNAAPANGVTLAADYSFKETITETDDGNGGFPDGGTVVYSTGVLSGVAFTNPPGNGEDVGVDYTYRTAMAAADDGNGAITGADIDGGGTNTFNSVNGEIAFKFSFPPGNTEDVSATYNAELVIAEQTTKTTGSGGLNDLDPFKPVSLGNPTSLSSVSVAAGKVVTLAISKAVGGVDFGGVIQVDYERD